MANLIRNDTVFLTASDWLTEFIWPPASHTDTEIRFVGADGSVTVVQGSGFAFSGDTPTAGTLSGLTQFLADGVTQVQTLTGLTLALTAFRTAIQGDVLPAAIFARDDSIFGGTQSDSLAGFAGNDSLRGGRGDDSLLGGDGNDRVDGGSGSDNLSGGLGTDTLVFDMNGQLYTNPDPSGTFDFSKLGTGVTFTAKDGMGGTDTIAGFERLIFLGDNVAGDRVIGGVGADVIQTGGWMDGGAGNDTLTGDAIADTLFGGAGNDVINGGGGANKNGLRFSASANIDLSGITLRDGLVLTVAQNGTDTLSGIAGFIMEGSAASDTLTGSSGDDEIFGGKSADRLTGGIGMDSLWLDAGADTLSGGTEVDAIRADYSKATSGISLDFKNFAAESSFVLGNDGFGSADQISGMNFVRLTMSNLRDTVLGSAGDDLIDGLDGADLLDGMDGKDNLNGGAGNDTLRGGAGFDELFASSGNDVLSTGEDGGQAYGGSGNDSLLGSDLADRLWGDGDNAFSPGGIGVGNDTIVAGAGNDIIGGGRGDDLIFAGDGDDRIGGGEGGGYDGGAVGGVTMEYGYDTGADRVDGGAGNDTFLRSWDETGFPGPVRYIFQGLDSVSTFFVDGKAAGSTIRIESLIAFLSDGNDTLVGPNGSDTINGRAGNDRITTGEGNDELVGGAGDDLLYGMAGDDRLFGEFDFVQGPNPFNSDYMDGGAGDDLLVNGVGGNDTLVGGEGYDRATFDYKNIGAGVTVDLSRVNLTTPVTIRDGVGGTVRLSTIESIGIIGTGQSDTVIGAQGDNRFEGYLGADKLTGGTGRDALYGDHDTLSGALQSLPLTDMSADTLRGLAGDDALLGQGGNDFLYGGEGQDALYGGDGNDTLNGDDGDDYLTDYVGDNILRGGDGNDVLTAGLGNSTLLGEAGNDRLSGTAGNDHLFGGAGNEQFILDAGDDRIDGGTGFDIFRISLTPDATGGATFSAASISAFFGKNETKQYIVSFDTFGTDTISGMNGLLVYGTIGNDRITGSAGDDDIWGFDGANTVSGGAGNDRLSGDGSLYGGAGDDAFGSLLYYSQANLFGGTGTDIAEFVFDFEFDDQEAVIFDASQIGPGRASGTVTYRHSDLDLSFEMTGVEGILINTWWQADNITGSDGNDVIRQSFNGIQLDAGDTLIGLGGDDWIEASSRSDSIFGGLGNDTYAWTGSENAVITLTTTQGQATGEGIGNDRLQSIENAQGGTGNDSITGSSAANLLGGGAGDDTLSGGLGNDTLDGGAPTLTLSDDDLLTGGSGTDNFLFRGGEDRIVDFTDNVDTVLFDKDLWGGITHTNAWILSQAKVTANGVMFDFGAAGTLTLTAVTSISILANDIGMV